MGSSARVQQLQKQTNNTGILELLENGPLYSDYCCVGTDVQNSKPVSAAPMGSSATSSNQSIVASSTTQQSSVSASCLVATIHRRMTRSTPGMTIGASSQCQGGC